MYCCSAVQCIDICRCNKLTWGNSKRGGWGGIKIRRSPGTQRGA